MATKDLSRSVIEGGRSFYNCWARRNSNARQRVREKEATHRLTAEDADGSVMPKRQPVTPWFHDKLGPARRWLTRQVGRPWNLVYSELTERFDTRTTPGRHIVFEHMLKWVELSPKTERHWSPLIVDDYGILRRSIPRYSKKKCKERLAMPTDVFERWVNERRVDCRGTTLFWFTPTAAGFFRQSAKLDEEETKLWRSLPSTIQKQFRPQLAQERQAHVDALLK